LQLLRQHGEIGIGRIGAGLCAQGDALRHHGMACPHFENPERHAQPFGMPGKALPLGV